MDGGLVGGGVWVLFGGRRGCGVGCDLVGGGVGVWESCCGRRGKVGVWSVVGGGGYIILTLASLKLALPVICIHVYHNVLYMRPF